MTRANSEQKQAIPWFAKAGAACSIVPIARFVTNHLFALKGGGYGCLFRLTGLDEECLTDQELDSHLRTLEGALRGLPEGACLYQYSRIRSGFALPKRHRYPHRMTDVIVGERVRFLDKEAGFRRMDIHWCLTVEPETTEAFKKKPQENEFVTSRMLAELEKAATLLAGNLGSLFGFKILDKEPAYQFFSYLFNLEDWAEQDHLRSNDGVDRQIVKSPVHWESDHLRVGKRFVQMFSLKMTPEASRPCLFSDLAKLDCDSILCTTWKPKSTTAARGEIDRQEKFIEFFKVGVLTRVMSGRDTASLDKGAGARAANNQVDDLGEMIRSLDRKSQGEFSLRLLIAARSRMELLSCAPSVHRVFVESRAQVMEETLGNLSAFYAMFPGNGKFNVFPLWLAEDHNARLASVFAPHLGHPRSEDLDSEYLNIFETRTGTPFFQDAYVDGVRVQLILGPTGSGKTTVLLSVREGAEQSGYVVEGFAPTSRAAGQLREAGIRASTLQSFLVRTSDGSPDPHVRNLYMVDESSLASTRQMRDFLNKLTPNDRVLLIGDTRQHQGVDAGRPFQQMQEAGMRTSELDRIMRQKDAGLLKAVEHLSKNETREGISLLQQQGRITELTDRRDRIAAIARDYAERPEGTIVISPDNRSRQEINLAIRSALAETGVISRENHSVQVLSHRSDMTGADRTWAARYNVGDVLEYSSGSKTHRIDRGSHATVRIVDARTNTLTVELANGGTVTYDPKRLRGVNVFQEQTRDFAIGDRLQFVSPLKELAIANRDLATILHIDDGRMRVRMDGKEQRTVDLDLSKVRHFDHGYAVTSHSSQGLTSTRVLAHFDTDGPRLLINSRLAYVAISRASEDAHVYTNDAVTLGKRLAVDVSKRAAIEPTLGSQTTQHEMPASESGDRHLWANPASAHRVKVHKFASSEHRLRSVALAYAEQRDRAVVVAFDPDERHQLSDFIRSGLRERGWLGCESCRIDVAIEREIANRRLAANYLPGDRIHYNSGSPKEHCIAHGSSVSVIGVDSKANLLVVITSDGSEITFNPASMRRMTDQSRVVRVEQREIAEGDRIQFTRIDRARHIHERDLATVQQIDNKGFVTVKLDSGQVHLLRSDRPLSVEYGYVLNAPSARRLDRVLFTGKAEQFSQQQKAVNSLARHAREVSVFRSDGSSLQQVIGARTVASSNGLDASLLPHREESKWPGFGIGR